MRPRFLLRGGSALIAVVLSTASLAAVSGCARTSYWDPVYSDNHRWDSREEAAYRRWEAERRLEHIEFRVRREEEQREFWRWRHDHPDR